MKHIRPIFKGLAISLTVFLILGILYRIGRHSFEQTNEVVLMGKPVEVVWQNVETLPKGRGLVILTPLVSSAELIKDSSPEGTIMDVGLVTGNQVQYLDLRLDDAIPIEAELVSRKIVNRFGTQICSWRCYVSGQLDVRSNHYYLLVSTSGAGDAGYTITFEVQDCGNLEFRLNITERLWSGETRESKMRFKIHDDGSISAIPSVKRAG